MNGNLNRLKDYLSLESPRDRLKEVLSQIPFPIKRRNCEDLLNWETID